MQRLVSHFFSFGIVDAKEKSYQKRKAPKTGGAAPPPRKLLEKLDQSFSHKATKTLKNTKWVAEFYSTTQKSLLFKNSG